METGGETYVWGDGVPLARSALEPRKLDNYTLQCQEAGIANLLRAVIGILIGRPEIDTLPLVLLCFQTLIKFIPPHLDLINS